MHAPQLRRDAQPQHSGMRRVPRQRRHVGPSSAVPNLRPRRLLRTIEKQARIEALPRDAASDRDFARSWRRLDLVLYRRDDNGPRTLGASQDSWETRTRHTEPNGVLNHGTANTD